MLATRLQDGSEASGMTPTRRLTIKEVARTAGVSTQTVSRVLNNRPDVTPETFERVQRVSRMPAIVSRAAATDPAPTAGGSHVGSPRAGRSRTGESG